jgi:16S rRNA (uracil1498-N3)-methyltransferase
MPQIFINCKPEKKTSHTIIGDEFHHFIHVRRHGIGDHIDLRYCDGSKADAIIETIGSDNFVVNITSINKPGISEYELCLAIPILKGKGNDLVIEKGVEIGVTQFLPVEFDRSVPDISSITKKLDRYRKIIHAAFTQSNAVYYPQILDPVHSMDLFTTVTNYRTKLLSDVHSNELLNATHISESVLVVIGPEGGFSTEELTLAQKNDFKSVKIGTNQMKAESASVIVPSIVRHYMYGRFNDGN